MTATGSRGRPEDGSHNVHETRNGFEAIQLLGTNPPMLHIFPVEAHPSARGVEEERMDDVHRRPVAREDRLPGRAEHNSAEPGLFSDFHDRPVLPFPVGKAKTRPSSRSPAMPVAPSTIDPVAGSTPPTNEKGAGEAIAVPDARPGTIPRARSLMRIAPATSQRRRR